MSQYLANLVVDNVFIGSKFAAEDDVFLEQNHITGVVNLVMHIVPNYMVNSFVQYLPFTVHEDGILLDDNDEMILKAV